MRIANATYFLTTISEASGRKLLVELLDRKLLLDPTSNIVPDQEA